MEGGNALGCPDRSDGGEKPPGRTLTLQTGVQTEAVPQGFMAEVGIPRGKVHDRPRAVFSPAPDCPPDQDRWFRGASSSGVPSSRESGVNQEA